MLALEDMNTELRYLDLMWAFTQSNHSTTPKLPNMQVYIRLKSPRLQEADLRHWANVQGPIGGMTDDDVP